MEQNEQVTTQPPNEPPPSEPIGSPPTPSEPVSEPTAPPQQPSPPLDEPDEPENEASILDLVEGIGAPTPPPVSPQVTPPAPLAPPAAQSVPSLTPSQPVAAPAGVTPAPAASAPVQPSPAAPTPTPPPAVPTPEQLAAQQTQFLKELEGFYAIPTELHSKLMTEPEAVLPQVAARLHVAVFQAVQNSLLAQVPNVVRNVAAIDKANVEAETFFYTGNEDLRPYDQQVRMLGATFRQMNPTASKEEAKRAIATAVRASLNLAQRPPSVPPPTPRSGFTPAVPFGGGAPADVAPNIFTELANSPLDYGD